MTYGAAGAGVGACIGALEAAWMVNPGPTPFRTTLTLMGGHAAMFGSIAAVFAATEARRIPQTTTPARARHVRPPARPLPRPSHPNYTPHHRATACALLRRPGT
jgi:hypothetical protein